MPNADPSAQPIPPPLRQSSRCRLFFPAPSNLSRADRVVALRQLHDTPHPQPLHNTRRRPTHVTGRPRMIRSYWNALRVGDAVMVHDDTDRDFTMSPGMVTAVYTRQPTHSVSIRLLDTDQTDPPAHPKRLAVHLASGDSLGECWRCDHQPSPTAAQ